VAVKEEERESEGRARSRGEREELQRRLRGEEEGFANFEP